MSENFIVSARKYRPQSWETVVGQKSITGTLRNAIAQDQIAQAYLFCGPRGVGKTTCARIFANEINADAKSSDQDLSFNVFELDAASNNSVEDIRSLTDQVRIPPQLGKFKVYIIDEVHMLSQAAFNAFLKTLEEPPPHAIFILATTEKHKIIPTILSRCQIFDFQRIQIPDMVEHLKNIAEKEGVTAEEDALHIVAQKADGALRDALSIFDQLIAFCGKNLTYNGVIENLNVLDYDYYFKMTEHFIAEDISSALLTLDDILNKGFDAHHFITGLGEHLRNLMVCKDPQTVSLLEVGQSIKERYVQQAQDIDIRILVKGLQFINECDVNYKTSNNQRLLAEFALIQIASIKHNLAEKKNSEFVLKPFKETKSSRLKQQIRSISTKEVAAEKIQEVKSNIPVAKKPLVVGHGPEHKYSFGSPLLSDLLKTEDEKKDDHQDMPVVEKVEEIKNEDFTTDEFLNAWKEFALQIKKQDLLSIYNTLTHKNPTLKGGIITIEIHNSIQEDKIRGIKGDILGFLKNRLNNTNLDLTTVMIREEAKDSKAYTDTDKYKIMKEKNPSLDYFRKKFNLDLEF